MFISQRNITIPAQSQQAGRALNDMALQPSYNGNKNEMQWLAICHIIFIL